MTINLGIPVTVSADTVRLVTPYKPPARKTPLADKPSRGRHTHSRPQMPGLLGIMGDLGIQAGLLPRMAGQTRIMRRLCGD